ncbi:stalk domain-containing protein [Thermicanus aegyptius]|uniref:stalk domain-containing protein n=1 Tax=Thermicanus aegyptius TaxID=94009 RepID=UPI00040B8A74|nr:stalk domain-containing protein [Thermicanus aegyptius]
MKRISIILVFTLMISLFASVSAFAASETKIETEQGGYVTLSNIVKEVELIREDPEGSDKAYISDGAVTLKIVGDDPHPTINYYADAEIKDGFFVPAGERKSVEITGNSVTLTEPGYYSGFVYFGGDFSFSSTATFVIQVVGGSADKPASSSEKIPATATAKPTNSKVLVNGKEISFQAYNINGNNYFKLRDLAMVLNGTEKSFEVGWDGKKNAISLESGKAYTAVGGELVVTEKPATAEAKLSTSTIYLDGKEVKLTAYLINGNNYFKLRDVAAVINFGVTWDGVTNTVGIDSSSGYVEE